MAEPGLFTLGVEEEFQIVDPKSRELKSHIQQIIEDGKMVMAEKVKAEYYPESAALMKRITGASAVFVFDHNVRNKRRSEAGQPGVRLPVEGAHNDYTLSSGPRRIREILTDALAKGWNGPIIVEPHLSHSGAVAATGPSGVANQAFSTMKPHESFAVALDAAHALLKDVGAEVN